MELAADTLVSLLRAVERQGITVWLDGGWGTDALLQRQTRPHGDADLVVTEDDLPALVALLEGLEYRPVERDDTRAWNFVMGDAEGHQVDIHVVVFDAAGDGIYGPSENGEFYPAQAFTGRGRIDGMPVRCLSPEFQIANRQGYRLRECDHHDLRLLRAAFGP